MDDSKDDLAAREIDPEALAIPVQAIDRAHSTTHIEAALRASGLESEIATALPVRGGDGPQHWGEWEDASWTGAFGRKPRLDIDLDRIRWPQGLYIPRDADYRDYWLTPPPSGNRYALAWPAPTGATGWARDTDGAMYAFANTPWSDPGADDRTEAGIGVDYSPDFTLGTVDFEPIVNLQDGMLTSVLNYDPLLSAGGVTLRVSVVLALWQVIPGGFDLIDHATFVLARITRDQSYGPERHRLPGTLYTPRTFRKRFLVQGDRTYLFGAVVRAESISSLTDTQGRKLVIPQPSDNDTFTVYSWATLGIPYMTIDTAQVYIP